MKANKMCAVFFVVLASALQTAAFEVRQFFRPERLDRGDTNCRRLQPIDAADWVWMPGHDRWGVAADSTAWNVRFGMQTAPVDFFRFRTSFTADETGTPLRFDVSADERFVLYLDGRQIAQGPQRGLVDHWFYQSYEVTNLAPGEHALEAVCWQLGLHAPLAQLSYRGGFIVKAEGAYDAKLSTGKAAWQVARLTGTTMTDRGTSKTFGVGSQCRQEGTGFANERPADGAWKPAAVVRTAVKHNSYGGHTKGWMLFPADRPDQTYAVKTPGRVVNVARDLTKSFTVPAKTTLDLWWDLDDYYCAYPELETAGGKGAVVTWGWAESLQDPKVPGRRDWKAKGNRDAWRGRDFLQTMTDTYVCDGRPDAFFSAPWWRCGRWCRVTVKTADEPLTVRRIALAESRYPMAVDGSFACDEPSMDAITRISRRTMESCMHEMLFDCPYYEQQMYPGDTRIQLQVINALTRDPRMTRFAISAFEWDRRHDGMVSMNFPTRGTQESATYTFCWLMMFGDYARWHDDATFLRHRLPGARASLMGLALYENADGLVANLPGWSFMDWVEGRDGFPGGVAPDGSCERPSALNNLQYLLALQSVAYADEAIGETAFAAIWRAKAARLKAAIVRHFFDEGRGLLADNLAKDRFSEHAQAMAIIADILTPAQRAAALAALEKRDPVLAPASSYFAYYLFDAFARCGRADLIRARLDMWKRFLAWGARTAFETQHCESRSDCHAWCACPLYFQQTVFAGVTPDTPFFRTVRIAPQPAGFRRVTAKTPCPKGVIETELNFAEKGVSGTVTLPAGLTGVFEWQGAKVPLKAAKNEIAIGATTEGTKAPVELRVRATAGGPKLFLDGKAIPPRMLYTPSNNKVFEIGTAWQSFDLPFTPALPRETCTLHFRFEKNAVQVFLRDVEIVGPDGKPVACAGSFADMKRFRGTWSVNLEHRCGEIAEAEGGLCVSVAQPKIWHDDFHLYSHPFATTPGTRYRLRFSAKASHASQLYPAVYEAGGKQYQLAPFEGLDVMEGQIRIAAAAGVDLVSIPVPGAWCADGYDFSQMDAIFRRAIAVNPKILILPRFGIDAPRWYLLAHPEARIRFSDGREELSVSIAEPAYRAAACAYTEATARHLRATFPRNFAGLHVNGLSTGEWAYQNRSGLLSGCETATRDAFRRYLATLGDRDAATAEVPDEAVRRAGAEKGFMLRDAVHNPRVSAFARFRQENLTSFLAELGAAVRRGTDNALLSVFFYGYTWDLAGREWGPAGTGHYGLQNLLARDADKFDILCSPYSYNSRGWPATGPAMSPAETVGRAGILWLTENDTRTYRVLAWDSMQLNSSGRHPMTKPETEQVLARLTAFDMIRGYGCWWMDLFGHGWYEDADLWREGLTRLAPLEKAMLARTTPFSPDVAVIADEAGLLDVVPGGSPISMLLSQHYGYDLCGAPYGQYLLDDFLAHGAKAHLQFYPLVFALSAAQRAALVRERLSHPEKTRVWCWAPGLVGEKGVDAANVETLTGFKVARRSVPLRAEVTSTDAGRAAGLPPRWGFAMPHRVEPLYAVVTQPGDEVWARYEDGAAAVVVRPTKAGGADVFLGTAHLHPAFIAAVTRRSAVHRYTEPGQATVCAAEGIVAIQAQVEGPLGIDFGRAGTVADLLTGKTVGTGPKLNVPFAKGELRVFRVQ